MDKLSTDKLSAMTSIPYEGLKVSHFADAATMTQIIRADLEKGLARQVQGEVIRTLAASVGMDPYAFTDFVKFLSEDPELQARFTSWRAKRRLAE
jgi:hypothetical protein